MSGSCTGSSRRPPSTTRRLAVAKEQARCRADLAAALDEARSDVPACESRAWVGYLSGQTVEMAHVLPDPQVLDRPGTIRWAVGSPQGPRSHSWNVVGHGTRDEVFISVRERMADIKLSLHEVKWRMAYTEQARSKYMPDDVDRVVGRWERSPEIADGWQRGACIVIVPSNLGAGYAEKKVKGGPPVPFYPATTDGWGLRFDVMLGRPARAHLTVEAAAANVGEMTLASGACVWVVASEVPVDETYEEGLAELRRYAVSIGGGGSPTMRGWAWGADDGGVPVLIDLSILDGE